MGPHALVSRLWAAHQHRGCLTDFPAPIVNFMMKGRAHTRFASVVGSQRAVFGTLWCAMMRYYYEESLWCIIMTLLPGGVIMRSHYEKSLWGVIMRSHYEGSLWGVIMRDHYEESLWGVIMTKSIIDEVIMTNMTNNVTKKTKRCCSENLPQRFWLILQICHLTWRFGTLGDESSNLGVREGQTN